MKFNYIKGRYEKKDYNSQPSARPHYEISDNMLKMQALQNEQKRSDNMWQMLVGPLVSEGMGAVRDGQKQSYARKNRKLDRKDYNERSMQERMNNKAAYRAKLDYEKKHIELQHKYSAPRYPENKKQNLYTKRSKKK
ncbi:MAG: hypothetical protein LBN07_04875 [Christensenellaceae bacterium]|jgi:hypothetical protein|nr:hypothetical protein [Christensenellaceae bacterium]